ncbi:hypothetical protein L1987_37340 [Smallanthus sonchifolius]|uniref:Uncharacterized protein n=1 Tax=Smallanthus sonchifolius TaxID=185202 RepID=A0ACB9HG29_9ASTR|nr:hypothetical protein L1987_37340 [Smallanthus sonchifolius]
MEEFLKEVDHVPSERALRNWRKAVSLTNIQRGSNEQDKSRLIAKIRAHAQVTRAALMFYEASMRHRLEDVLSATNNFSDENLITGGALGKVYNGQWHRNLMNVVVQRNSQRLQMKVQDPAHWRSH